MASIEKLTHWIESGKQIGKTICFNRNGERCWSSVGVQKWNDIIKVHIDEILEKQMSSETYLREDTMDFPSIDLALTYISEHTRVKPEEMSPCKGQKIFNPKLN